MPSAERAHRAEVDRLGSLPGEKYEDYFKLLQDVQKHHLNHPGDAIVADDNPVKLTLGFTAGPKRWFIHITRVKASLFGTKGRYFTPVEGVDLLQLLKSAEGRQEIARMLSAGEPLFA